MGLEKVHLQALLKPNTDYINADEIQKYLKCDNLEAAKLAESQREDHIEKNRHFVLKQSYQRKEI